MAFSRYFSTRLWQKRIFSYTLKIHSAYYRSVWRQRGPLFIPVSRWKWKMLAILRITESQLSVWIPVANPRNRCKAIYHQTHLEVFNCVHLNVFAYSLHTSSFSFLIKHFQRNCALAVQKCIVLDYLPKLWVIAIISWIVSELKGSLNLIKWCYNTSFRNAGLGGQYCDAHEHALRVI